MSRLNEVNPVFADTSFYLALLRKDDSSHVRAIAEARIARTLVTTEAILLELGNACARARDHVDFLSLTAGLRASKRVKIVEFDRSLLNRGLELFAARSDKDWSLTDCISFVVMSDSQITDALTADKHFAQAGFQPLLT